MAWREKSHFDQLETAAKSARENLQEKFKIAWIPIEMTPVKIRHTKANATALQLFNYI